MYFTSTPTPGFKQTAKEGGLSTTQDSEYIESIQSDTNNVVPQEASDYIKTYLQGIPGLDLNNSKSINLRIEIIDDVSVGEVLIISKNTNRTITTISVSDNNWPESKIEIIKPVIKWPNLGKCRNCLKFSFDKTLHDLELFNFIGSIGGNWDGTWKNNQKVYQVQIPDFSQDALNNGTYGQNIDYRIFWKPLIPSFIVNVFGGGSIPTGGNRWILLPSASIGTVNELGDDTYYHILSGVSASCPFTPNPSNPAWNFFGTNGRLLLESVSTGATEVIGLPTKCPEFIPTPGPVDWGWNCGPNGCVSAPSGTLGTYATFESCSIICNPTSSSWYDCTFNGCIQVPSGSGSYTSLDDCLKGCNTASFITTCSCLEVPNVVINSDFSNNLTNWNFSPNIFTPGIGGWINGQTPAVTIQQGFNADITSSVFLSQTGVLNPSCSYDVCFQAWALSDPADQSIAISIDTGIYPIDQSYIVTYLNPYPTAYTIPLNSGQFNTTDLTLYFSSPNQTNRISVDNFCVKLRECKPAPEDDICIITGSAYCFTDIEYDCLCPEGFSPDGSGSCASGSILTPKILTGTSINAPITTHPSWGINAPFLYYYYDTGTGLPSSSLAPGTVTSPAHPSSFFGDPNVWNTQFTWDMLKAPFWRGSPNGYTANLFRKIPTTGLWYGGGSYINVPVTKTYYVGLIADDQFRFSINNTIIAAPNPSDVNIKAIASSLFPNNPYLTSNLTGNISGNWTFRSLHIYPVTVPSGCNFIKLEARDANSTVSGLGAVIFDMTAEEIVNATSEADLNVIWDSRNDLIFNLNTGITASCPTGTTPLGPEPCDLCQATGSILPCGTCIECTNGYLYNGYVLDKGGNANKGRGSGGIVNTNAIDNPINTWTISDNFEWANLLFYINNSTPSITDYTGIFPGNTLTTTNILRFPSAGGKLKDYTRDNIASCWGYPNAGAQVGAFNSGWAGIAGGIRLDNASYTGLGFDGYWWSTGGTAAAGGSIQSAVFGLKHWSNDAYRYILAKNHGCSIRLVRPAVAGEANGTIILDAYKGKNGLLYDGIVINGLVWITKNLSETLYNDGTTISNLINPALDSTWSNATFTSNALSAVYDNNLANTSSLSGNINPATGLCYEYPVWYTYRKCDGTAYLAQTEPGAATISGEVQKADDLSCWEYIGEVENNTNLVYQQYITGNYFENNPTIYTDCEECSAIHTVYMTFGTTNC